MATAGKESRIDPRGANLPENPMKKRLWDQARFVSGNRSLSSRSTDSDGIGGPKR